MLRIEDEKPAAPEQVCVVPEQVCVVQVSSDESVAGKRKKGGFLGALLAGLLPMAIEGIAGAVRGGRK